MSAWPEPVWLVTDAVASREPLPAALEGLAQARALTRVWGGGIRVLLLAADKLPAGQVEEWFRRGADRVTIVQAPLSSADVRVRVDVLATVLGYSRPRVLLVAASPSAEAWAGRLAARLRLPVVTGCIEAKVSATGLEVRREILKGALNLEVAFELRPGSTPAVLLMEPGSWPVPEGAAGASGALGEMETITFADTPLPADRSRGTVSRIRRIPAEPGAIDLGEATLVLAGGAGLGTDQAFLQLREVARSLGAGVGASRVAVDRGWARPEEQIGLTGRKIAPQVYVAFGISGSREHLCGVRDAQHVVAINTDPLASIAGVSQVFALADARAVLAALAAEVQARSEQGSRR